MTRAWLVCGKRGKNYISVRLVFTSSEPGAFILGNIFYIYLLYVKEASTIKQLVQNTLKARKEVLKGELISIFIYVFPKRHQ